MAGTGKMSRKRETAISALLTCSTVNEAAQVAGIGERTLWRWLQAPDFQEQYRQARREAVNHAVSRLQQAGTEAVETLRMIMADLEAPANARVSAARTVLEQALRSLELEDLETRLTELESLVKRRD